jgi:dihydrofolate reductase
MGRVILDISMSLDGFVAGPNVNVENPLGDHGARLHDWMFRNPTDGSRKIVAEVFGTAGAIAMGRRTFDLGKPHWDPEPDTFRQLPVFVLTHRYREPVVDEGGSTFTFITDGVERAVAQARAAAGDRDVVSGGGAAIGQELMRAGLLDELRIHLVNLLLLAGTRLFDLDGAPPIELERVRVVETPGTTHFTFRVVKYRSHDERASRP